MNRTINMPLEVIAIVSTESQFGQRHLRDENLRSGQLHDMLCHATALVEMLNPRVCVKNVLLHSRQSMFTSRSTSFSRHSLMAASMRAASSGSSAQQPARRIRPAFRSSSLNGGGGGVGATSLSSIIILTYFLIGGKDKQNIRNNKIIKPEIV